MNLSKTIDPFIVEVIEKLLLVLRIKAKVYLNKLYQKIMIALKIKIYKWLLSSNRLKQVLLKTDNF